MDREDALKRQFIREARIGVSLIGVVFAVFIFVAYSKLSGGFGRSTDLSLASTPESPSTKSSSSQHGQTAYASPAAIQASTQSIIDQVEPRVGETSATNPPPIPAPRRVTDDTRPTTNHSEEASGPASGSTIDRPVTLSDTLAQANEQNRTSPGPLKSFDQSQFNPRLSSPWVTKSAEGSPEIASADDRSIGQFPVRQAYSVGNNSQPNQPIVVDHDEVSTEASPIPLDTISRTEGTNGINNPDDSSTTTIMKSDDSLWRIAQRHYDDGRFFRALAAFNQLGNSNSDSVGPGTKIRVPSRERLQTDFPDLIPADLALRAAESSMDNSELGALRTYVTGNDDTLFTIARDQLGQASRYIEIIELNSTILPQNVTSNTRLPGGIRLCIGQE